jgi:PAS domain S-box-containing protein
MDLQRAFVYFDEKDPGFDVGSRQAAEIVEKARQVFDGKRSLYEVDYEREHAGERRTFRLSISRPSLKELTPALRDRCLIVRRDLTGEAFDRHRFWQFEFALKRTGQYAVFLDAQGRILFANDRICRTLGHSRETLLDSCLWDIDPHYPKTAWQTTLKELRQLGTLVYRSELRTLEGLIFPVEVTASYVERDGFELVVVFCNEPTSHSEAQSGSFRFQQKVAERTSELAESNQRLQQEIASHRQTETALLKSQERLELALWGTNLGLWDWDIASGRMTFDDRWAAMVGYGVGELEPHLEGWTGLVHPDDEAALRRSLDEHLEGQTEVYELAHRLNHREGEYRWFMARGKVAERDAAGNARRVTGTLQDITERKQLEGQLLQSQKMEAIGQLAGGVAHDFNNLLTAINGYSDLVLRKLEPESPHRDKVREIRRAGERAAVLTSRLLAFGRQQLLQPEPLELNLVVSNLEPLIKPALGEGVNLVIQLEEHLPMVRTDLAQVEQAILNMVVNARDAMPAGGTLTIETRKAVPGEVRRVAGADAALSAEYVRLSIRDVGKGIPPELIDRVFEPFFTTKASGEGTGLGLSMVYGVVHQSAGFIDLRSRVDEGTEIRIYLPTTSKHASGAHRLSQLAGRTDLRGDETILLVEDEMSVRGLIASTLEANGYRVLQAEDADEAIRRVREAPIFPSLLLTDVILPGRSGAELARQLHQEAPNLEVLYVSGYPRDALDRREILDRSINFLQKPFELDVLMALVRRLLDRRQSPSHPPKGKRLRERLKESSRT